MSAIEDAFASAQNRNFSDLEEVQGFIDALCEAGAAPGISVEIRHGEQSISASSGIQNVLTGSPMSRLTQFRIGCVTKVFTSLAIGQAVKEGLLDLNAEVAQYLPQLKDSPSMRGVRIWHLMSHSSGLASFDMWDPFVVGKMQWDDYTELLMNDRKLFAPGSVFNYDHVEHVILGHIYRSISGEAPIDFQDRVLKELGLISRRETLEEVTHRNQDHFFDITDNSFKPASGKKLSAFWDASLSDRLMTLEEVASLGAAALNGFSSTPFAASAPILERQVIGIPKSYGSKNAEQTPLTFGLGWAGYSGDVLGHNGSSFGQTTGLRFDPTTKTVIAVGLNVWSPYIRDRLICTMLSGFQGRHIDTGRRRADMVSIDEVPGFYVNGIEGEEIRVSIENGAPKAIHFKGGSPVLEIGFQMGRSGELEIVEDLRHGSFGFFRNPKTQVPAIQFGMFAFAKTNGRPAEHSDEHAAIAPA